MIIELNKYVCKELQTSISDALNITGEIDSDYLVNHLKDCKFCSESISKIVGSFINPSNGNLNLISIMKLIKK